MKVSTRTRYSVRAAMELADNYENGPLQLRVIAERQGISVKYLEQLMSVLMSGGFVRSVRGARGGYVLARPPASIRVSEIFHCLEGQVATVECVADGQHCSRSPGCSARKMWQAVEKAIDETLGSFTLEDLLNMGHEADSVNYQI
jgi:Rrf2 family protein